MRNTIIFGLALIAASVLSVSAADLPGNSTNNRTTSSSSNKGKSSIQSSLSDVDATVLEKKEKSSVQAVRDTLQSNNNGVLTRDDVEKAAAYQGLIGVVTTKLNTVEDSIMVLRRQIQPIDKKDLDDVQRNLEMSEKALDELAVEARYSVDRIQEEDLRDKLFDMKLSLELLRKRLGVGGTLAPFGMDFFHNVSMNDSSEATSAVPMNYSIRPKDKILILASSKLGAQTEYHEQVTADGILNIPGVGSVRAAGITITQLSSIANKRVSARFKQMKLNFTIESISAMTIQVAGDVLKPGTYNMPGMSTLMSALYKAGGPSISGSLRNITLTRVGMPKRRVDLYKFLLEGSKDQDIPLRDGDLIFVPSVGKTIAIDGEVVRAARYEPQFPLTLDEALKMAGGVKTSGYLQQVSVERIQDGEYRILVNTSIQDTTSSKYAILPGDQITVSSVRPERTNIVTINGPVMSPGEYGFRPNMRISDLVTLAQGIDPSHEVFSGRADVLRLHPLEGTELISFDLGKAIAKDPKQDIELQKLDRVFLYLPDQVAFRNNRIRVSGAVSKPGVYVRTVGMNVSDAIAAAGGVLPEAHLKRADLIRYKSDNSQELIQVDLGSALTRNVTDDIRLDNRDELMVYTNDEAGWKASTVRIEGAVQRNGSYKRVDNMRLSDLLFASGGLLPEAGKTAEIGRVALTGKPIVIKVNLSELVSGSEQDVLLSDRDTITIASDSSVLRVPEIVYLLGEVANPGPYTLSSPNEKLDDLIKRAGGLTQRADVNGLILMRKRDSFDNDQQATDVQNVLKSMLLYSDRQFLTQLSQMGAKLPDVFYERAQRNLVDLYGPLGASEVQKQQDGIANDLRTITSASGGTQNTVPDTIAAASTPSTVPIISAPSSDQTVFGKSSTEDRTANLNEKSPNKKNGSTVETSEEASYRVNKATFEHSAMGERVAMLSQDEPSGLAASANEETLLALARVSVDLKQAMANPASPDNLALRSGDRIRIPRQTDTVTVLGAVLHPHVFAAGSKKGVDYFIERSGGYALDAVASTTIIVHSNGDAVLASKTKVVVPGDMVVVPSTGLIDIAKKWEKVGSVTKVISDVLSSAYVLTRF